MRINGTPTEDEEQICLFRWAAYNTGKRPELAMMFHVPNGGKRNAIEAARFKAMGVKPGVPDIFLPVARGGYHGLFIELKRREGGTVSAAQHDMIVKLRAQGYKADTCKGWEAARLLIEAYLDRMV